MEETGRWRWVPVRQWSETRQECVCISGIILVAFVGAMAGLWYVATHRIPR